ncbi:SDR family NAD(P)-dependent oxidoreductase [Flavobacterium sp. '19STA2R22 D10 B1']|uniref:SDR family NAD(P)-dependent oxidoreductase n=1 Tax=Flavobacterium aerium TaxID=3037261 RepID=UPI00278C779F|nr:SDR family NAD(P)-dependent oxidoreductase [Flavobacterium sp. '19STA2R22 D10 B1']
MKKVSLLGCGTLGLPLAKHLISKGYSIKGSTTTESKISVLEQEQINPFQISVAVDHIEGDITSFLEESTTLIIDIPPSNFPPKPGVQEDISRKIETLISHIEKSTIEHVIFVGSTSVYSDSSENLTVTENDTESPESTSAKFLLEAEQLLLNNPNFKATIVRFGGLIGPTRHPIYYLAGRTDIANPTSPVNLIDEKDCIGVIEKIMILGIGNDIFNAVSPYHPSRKEYYTKKAIEFNLPLPQFNEEKESVGKTIDPSKLIQTLDYTFQTVNL